MAYTDIPDEEIAGNKPVLSATAVKLRDNTDDHTHEAGNGGALIQSDGLASSSVIAAKINKSFTSGSYTLATGVTQVLPVGVYQFNTQASLVYELFISGAWRTGGSAITNSSGMLFSDGTNMRIKNGHGTITLTFYFQKMT